MQQFLIEALDWLLSDGSGVLAALILGGLAVLALWIWKSIVPRIEESRLKLENEFLRQENDRLSGEAYSLIEQLDARAAEGIDLQDSLRTLTADLQDSRDQITAVRLSEQAHLLNLELLKSAIEDALGDSAATGPASPEAQGAARALGERYLRDVFRQILKDLSPQNFSSSKTRLESAIDFCVRHGVAITPERREELLAQLREGYRDVVRKAAEREEQARIKAQIREEARLEADRQRELQRMESQQHVIQEAIDRALARTHDIHSREVEDLRAQLEALKERERAISQAQLTRTGHVYVVSNIGSFGEGIYKIGMTRRLEPQDRIKELGSASVPFPFDVHMMISSSDAPTLETILHRQFHKLRLNRINPRKEFFRVDLTDIVEIVEQPHGRVDYIATADALEYRESQNLSEEDAEFVEGVLEAVGGEEGE